MPNCSNLAHLAINGWPKQPHRKTQAKKHARARRREPAGLFPALRLCHRTLVLQLQTYSDGVVQAPAPARLIEGGLPTEATVAQVLVPKYADHLPLYRQAQIYARSLAPAPAVCGPAPPTTVPWAGRIHRVLPMSMRPTARPSGRSPIWRASREFCRSTAMPVTANSPTAATSSLRSAE